MVREILCEPCGLEQKSRDHFNESGIANPYEGEYVKLKVGILKPRASPNEDAIKHYAGRESILSNVPTTVIPLGAEEYICDSCSSQMTVGSTAYARTIYADDVPYQEWERDYFEIESTN